MQPTYPPRPLAFVRGVGTHLWDDDGREYLDLVAGLAVVSLGHGHPAPGAALAAQQAVLGHVSNLYWSEPAIALAERLRDADAGCDGARTFFCNSGAEANEAAIKLARRRGRARGGPAKHEIVCLEGAFHGRTLRRRWRRRWARPKKEPFEPLPAGFLHVPPNDVDGAARRGRAAHRRRCCWSRCRARAACIRSTPAFLAPRASCATEHDALLLFDEVQTGIGRCGAWLALPPARRRARRGHAGQGPRLRPADRRAGGARRRGRLRAAATTPRPSAARPPIAAAALAVLDAIEREGLVENAEQVGTYLARRLRALPGVADVRGPGPAARGRAARRRRGARWPRRLLDARRAGQRRDADRAAAVPAAVPLSGRRGPRGRGAGRRALRASGSPRRSSAAAGRGGVRQDVGVPPGLLRLYHAARAFAFGYFFGLGFLALTHYATAWPETYDDAAAYALLAGGGGLVAWIVREASGPRSAA